MKGAKDAPVLTGDAHKSKGDPMVQCVCIYIYTHMNRGREREREREREKKIDRERERDLHTCMYIYIYMHTYIYNDTWKASGLQICATLMQLWTTSDFGGLLSWATWLSRYGPVESLQTHCKPRGADCETGSHVLDVL